MLEEQTTNWFQDDKIVPEPEVTETPAESSAEQKTDEKEAPATEGTTDTEAKPVVEQPEEDLPFHKHPRFKALTQENRELKAKLDEIDSKVNTLSQPKPAEQAEDVPQWFQQAFGDAPEVWQNYKAYNIAERQNIKAEALKEFQEAQERVQNKDKEFHEGIRTSIQALKDEGIEFDENDLMKVMVDHNLFDNQGKLNFRAGLAILQSRPKDDKSAAKKAVAAKTDTGRGEPEKKDYVTSSDLKGKSSWRDFK